MEDSRRAYRNSEVYAEMLGRAKEHSFAFPAINCVGSESINAAIKGFADAGSDGIIQFSTGGAEFGSGLGVKDMVTGAVALAEFAHVIAAKYDVTIALHTDHCPKDKLDTYVRPLLAISQERVDAGRNPLFQSHMWDGSAIPIDENLAIAKELLALSKAARIILEVEIGVVGGEEDGVEAEINDKLYTSSEDFEKTVDALGIGEQGKYLLAATFGNVHGVYKPGNVKLKPEVLEEGQKVAAAKLGLAAGSQPFDFVLPRWVGIAEVRDRGFAELRRRQDERRHRHPVRVLPSDRRTLLLKLRRRPQGRRRGRKQEGVRPAQLPQEGRSRHDGSRRRGVQRPEVGRTLGVRRLIGFTTQLHRTKCAPTNFSSARIFCSGAYLLGSQTFHVPSWRSRSNVRHDCSPVLGKLAWT